MKLIVKTAAGPSSYSSTAKPTITIGEVEKVTKAIINPSTGGYLPEVHSISGNVITYIVRYFDYNAGEDGVAIEVPNGTNLGGINFTVMAVGI